MRREADGALYVAGIRMNTEAEQGDVSDWILKQGRIVIRDATLQWHDVAARCAAARTEARQPAPRQRRITPPLRSDGAAAGGDGGADRCARRFPGPQFRSSGRRGREKPMPSWPTPISPSGASGSTTRWNCRRAAARCGCGSKSPQKSLTSVTADVAADNVRLRLKPELPLLDLAALNGRITARLPRDGFEVGGRTAGAGDAGRRARRADRLQSELARGRRERQGARRTHRRRPGSRCAGEARRPSAARMPARASAWPSSCRGASCST
ncbi:MAG: hypothetical protein MZW92_14970 [Comamonadaceae bacterium]|nr:hypothetical protein [Comamonadaceae bacterium]